MITFLILWILIAIIAVIRDWEEGSAFIVALVLSISLAVFSSHSNTYNKEAIVNHTTEVYSIKNFSATAGSGGYYSWYIGTDSDYISYIKKDGGFTKFRMPESSIIKENSTLTDKGYFTENVCHPGEMLNIIWFIGKVKGGACGTRFDRNPTISVPPNTVTLNFKV